VNNILLPSWSHILGKKIFYSNILTFKKPKNVLGFCFCLAFLPTFTSRFIALPESELAKCYVSL
jgi:hypothetical protein